MYMDNKLVRKSKCFFRNSSEIDRLEDKPLYTSSFKITQTEALAILNNLPNLEYLNGKSTKDDESHLIDLDEKEIDNISFDKEELEKFNVN